MNFPDIYEDDGVLRVVQPVESQLLVQLDEGAYMPVREHSTDGGLDLKSPIDCYIQPGDSAAIDTRNAPSGPRPHTSA